MKISILLFNMTKKFLLALNDCLKNTGIEVKTHFQRRCDCEEYNSECKECQRYNECVNEMMRDGFIKQTDNNKENNSVLSLAGDAYVDPGMHPGWRSG